MFEIALVEAEAAPFPNKIRRKRCYLILKKDKLFIKQCQKDKPTKTQIFHTYRQKEGKKEIAINREPYTRKMQ